MKLSMQPPTRSTESSEVIVAKEDWENFLSSLEHLMGVQKKTLEKLREVKLRNRALRAELKSALELPAVEQPRKGKKELKERKTMNICANCGNQLKRFDSFCDNCGTAVFRCECGRALSLNNRFCDVCGLPFSRNGA
jgi:predicted RNA-binding Zn-ribbon protein involved in translation (DUF1610 family)